MVESRIFPGDKVAIIEEFETGDNTLDDGHMIRSVVVGTAELDKKDRVARVNPVNAPLISRINDVVIGLVTSASPNMVAVTIHYINGSLTRAGIECICQRSSKGRKTWAKVGDIVMLRIISTMNGKIQASVEEPQLGVLFSKCIKCAGNVIKMGLGVKCVECGYVEERKLSANFGNENFIKLRIK